ncbi:hypothetical protein Pla22_34310 [Rubripirellula amarantea]|uniref:Secreted protein n=1 Tax=Rubripirellula amarantea TaxID=2527999 RepID=A0A5C5WIW6_9BACT|nr:hypothetical protein Pla22_34310 [Rubripirellula amarantea]
MRLSMVFLWMVIMISPVLGQDPFDWVVGDEANHGCWAETGDPPSTPCKDWWDSESQYVIDVFSCTGRCTWSQQYGRMGCIVGHSNNYKKPGPDLNAEDIAIGSVPSPTNPGPGNVPRYRDLKCVQKGMCRCISNLVGTLIVCRNDPTIPVTYDNPTSYITDAGGPACNPAPGG